ncbi:MAG: sulfite exporter TauE/SafE family protein [Actinomycetia bacterium]|nr:sulfite exporter TauE/SafE family protein [Actinomycetes bacterium]
MSPILWLVAFAVTLGAAVVQGTVGVGFAMISVPILLLIDPQLAPEPQLLTALPLSILIAWRERSSIELHGFWWIIVGRVPGAIIGVTLLAIASQTVLDMFTGIVVLAAVGAIATGFHVRRTRTTKFITGVTSGTTGVVASIGGPPIALLYSSAEATTIRSTLAAVFTLGLSLSIVFRLGTGHLDGADLRVAVVLLPAVGLGYVVSTLVKDRVPVERVRVAILVLSALAASALILRGLIT